MEPMKRLNDMSFEEILAITPGSPEYEHLIDLECAHAGVSLLPEHPGPKPETENIKPDGMLYKVGDWRFNTVEAAEAVRHFVIEQGIWLDSTDNGVHVMERMEQSHYYWPEIKSSPAFTPETFEQLKETILNISLLQKEWGEKKREFDSAIKERQSIVDEFTKKRDYAVEIKDGIAKIRNNLTRYLTLAQGSYPIAITFLKEADKQGSIFIEEEVVYYRCTTGKHYHVISREEHQNGSMHDLLTK